MTVAGAVSIYLIMTIGILFFDIIKYKRDWFDPLYSYLFFISLYIIPLGVRYIVNMPISGNVTYMFYSIKEDYIYAVLLMAITNFIFYLTYLFYRPGKATKAVCLFLYSNEYRAGGSMIAPLIIVFFAAGLFYYLSMQHGGILSFLFLGYGVTEELVKSPLLASSFPIMFTSSFLLISSAYKRKSKKLFLCGFIVLISMLVVCVILGRRAEIACWGMTFIIYYSCLYKKINFKLLLPLIISGFLVLNFIGMTRNSNYRSLEQIVDNIDNTYSRTGGSSYDWLYTLVDGQFVVPFESLPVIMSSDSISFTYGTTLLSNLAQWVPRFIWESKPYGLTRWYFQKFYDKNAPPNEGRAFFIYSEGYVNFGIIGILIWAVGYSIFWRTISFFIQFGRLNKSTTNIFIGSYFVSNMIKLVAADSSPIYVTLLKESILWFVIPMLLVSCVKRIKL